MTIALITEAYLPTTNGIVRHIELLRGQLQKLGHTVQIIAPAPAGVRVQTDAVHYVPSVPLPGDSGYHLSFPNLANADPIIARADVVHAHHPFALGSWAQRVAKRYHKPFIFTHHEHYPSYTHHVAAVGSLKKQSVVTFLTQFANASTAVIAPTCEASASLTSSGISKPIWLIPNGIDISRFSTGNGQKWRVALGIPSNQLLALYIGELSNNNHLIQLLQAFALTNDSNTLVLIGDGPARDSLEALAGQLGISQRTYFLGQIGYRSMPDIYAGADLLINSAGHNIPATVLFEAQAAGLPTISTISPEALNILKHGETALMVQPTTTDFSGALRQLSLRPALRHQLGESARLAAKRFSIERTANQLLDTYRLTARLTPSTR